MSNDVVIRTGISDAAQASDHANGTLQGSGNVAYTIATFIQALGTEAQVEQELGRKLSHLARAARSVGFIVTFEVAIGLADEHEGDTQ